MTSRATLACTALLAAACAGTFASTIARTTPSPGQAVFDCFAEATDAEGFDVLSVDKRDLRLVVVRVDRDAYVSDPTFRRAEDHLTLEVSDAENAAGASVRVIGQTFYVRFTRRGLERQERKASEAARLIAETITDRCAPSGQSVEDSP